MFVAAAVGEVGLGAAADEGDVFTTSTSSLEDRLGVVFAAAEIGEVCTYSTSLLEDRLDLKDKLSSGKVAAWAMLCKELAADQFLNCSGVSSSSRRWVPTAWGSSRNDSNSSNSSSVSRWRISSWPSSGGGW